jgi:hypothetical protein
VLFCMSALSAIKLLAGESNVSIWQRVVVPAFGAAALAAIIAVDVARSDPTTRAIEIGGLLLGIPFAFWRGAGMRIVQPAAVPES